MEILLGLLGIAFAVGLPVAIIFIITRLSTQSRKIDWLERQVKALMDRMAAPPATFDEVAHPVAAPQPEKAAPESGLAGEQRRDAPVEEPQPPGQPQPPKQTIEPAPRRSKPEWEALIGGKLLNRVGALALIIGIGFFLKYAFDNNWITETMRLVIGGCIGAGLLSGAWQSERKGLRVFSQGLVGAGIAILYLSVYASFNFYNLIPQVVAFALMYVVTVTAFLHALKYDSLAVALLGWAGGFLTPFMLSTSEPNTVGLFTYIAILDAGLLAVLLKKNEWYVLEPLTLIGTYAIYFVWYADAYDTSLLPLALFFLTVFWVLFHALDVLRILRGSREFIEVRQIVAIGHAFVYYAGLYMLLHPDHHVLIAPLTLLLAGVYFFTYLGMGSRIERGSLTEARFVIISLVVLAVAIEIQWARFNTVIAWSLEALAILWAAVRWGRRYLGIVSVLLFALATLRLLTAYGALSHPSGEAHILFLSHRSVAFLILTLSSAVGALIVTRAGEWKDKWMSPLDHYAWAILGFILVTIEVNDYFAADMQTDFRRFYFIRYMVMAAAWMAYSIPVVWMGLKREVPALLHVGFLSFVASVALGMMQGIAFEPVGSFALVVNIRTLIMLLLIVGAGFHLSLARTDTTLIGWMEEMRGVTAIGLVLLALTLVTGETRDYFRSAIAASTGDTGRVDTLENLKQLSLSGVWLLFSIALMGIGIWRRLRGLRIMAIVLFGFTILKIFIYDLSFLDTLYRIFSFVGLGVILLAVSYLYQRYKRVLFPQQESVDGAS